MSHRLIKTKTGEIISQYTELPKKVRVDELKLSYHSPSLGILDSTYSLLEEITIDKGGDVYVDETYQTTKTQYITTKNYRAFNQTEIDVDIVDKKNKDIQEIKNTASQDILKLFPIWKQNNLQADVTDLIFNELVKLGVFGQDQIDLVAPHKKVWEDVKVIRAKSDQDEAKL